MENGTIMKKILFLLLFLLISSFPLYGGERVVSLSPALTELICHLNQRHSLAGRSTACDYPAAVKQLSTAGNFGHPEVEKVFSLKPTWVIANDFMNPGAAKRFRQNGIPVDLRQIRTLNDYRWWVRRIGEKLSCQKAAAGELERTDRLEQQLKRKKSLPLKILWVIYDRPLMVAGPRSLPHQVITMMKMQNVAADVPDEYFKCSWEWILKNQPDWIIWTLPGKPQKNHRLWGNLTAVKKGRVITDIMDDPVQRPGPRWLESVLRLRTRLEKGAVR